MTRRPDDAIPNTLHGTLPTQRDMTYPRRLVTSRHTSTKRIETARLCSMHYGTTHNDLTKRYAALRTQLTTLPTTPNDAPHHDLHIVTKRRCRSTRCCTTHYANATDLTELYDVGRNLAAQNQTVPTQRIITWQYETGRPIGTQQREAKQVSTTQYRPNVTRRRVPNETTPTNRNDTVP